MNPATHPANKRFRILCVDGGGIRGLISVLVLEEIEKRLGKELGHPARISDYFHLFSGTSTGGLIALALTAPGKIDSKELASFYTKDGPKIFDRSTLQEVTNPWGLTGPLYSLSPLREAIDSRLGKSTLSEATRDLLVTSYDMTRREPYFFKRWQALEPGGFDPPIADAALATSAAPTYFPSHGIHPDGEKEERALVDGGVFAANPVIAAIAEALGRSSDEPSALTLEDLFVVSIGTGRFESDFSQSQVSGWGKLGWIAGGGSEPPILSAMLGGASDGANYWAHMLLNHATGEAAPHSAEIGQGPRFFRLQVELKEPIEMDDASNKTLTKLLPDAAKQLILEKTQAIDEIVEQFAPLTPLP
jgi:patatin-like phospholipase/acyl hydrolase